MCVCGQTIKTEREDESQSRMKVCCRWCGSFHSCVGIMWRSRGGRGGGEEGGAAAFISFKHVANSAESGCRRSRCR